MSKGIKFLMENSIFLILGTVAALIWANTQHESYEHLLHFEVLRNNFLGELHGHHRIINLHYVVNDVMMAFFFAIAGKEVWEAMLPGGPLSEPKKAATPLIATVGGMAGPAIIYVVGTLLLGQFSELGKGWAIPCATDIAFSYMVARIVFGKMHPAIPFLLLLAIADDAGGLAILAIFYPQEPIQFQWLILPFIAVLVGFWFRGGTLHFGQKFEVTIPHGLGLKSFWWYIVIPGVLSWLGFAKAGLHPALGLLPIIPTLPHAHSDLGIFADGEENLHDALNEFEHWWKQPVELILCLFGLFNAGVVFSSIDDPTWLVLIALLAGKPIGIFLCGMFSVKVLKYDLPEGMNATHLLVVGIAAAIGFTVALFVTTVAFDPGPIQDAAKMGALFSFIAAAITIVAGIMLRIERVK